MAINQTTTEAGEWVDVRRELPPEGVEVKTRIDDLDGVRNEQSLCRKGNLWFLPDFSMYVYYAPTHWWKRAVDNLSRGCNPT